MLPKFVEGFDISLQINIYKTLNKPGNCYTTKIFYIYFINNQAKSQSIIEIMINTSRNRSLFPKKKCGQI